MQCMNDIKRQGQLNRRCRKTSDAGFSLVELLIAVTILAIIVIPLLHMFVTSTKINVKSRQKLRATTVAQDIMEGLKAYTLEEVSAQFEPPEGVSGGGYHYPSDGFYIVNSSMIQGGVQDLTENMAGHVDGDEIYYFVIENLNMQGGEYDALIRLDASTYGKDKDATGAPHDNIFNKSYAEIGSVAEVSGGGDEAAKATDSSYHENKKLAEAVIKYAKEDFESKITSAGDVLPADWEDEWKDYKIEDIVTKREINVVIDDAGTKDAEGNEQCMATISFIYECSCPYSGYSYTCTTSGYAGSEAGWVENITRTFSSGNFYLFYYPIYKSTMVDNINFEIKNAAKLFNKDHPLLRSITLAKQIRSDIVADGSYIVPELTEADLKAKESAYMARVDISANDTPENKLIFRSNVGTNMVKNSLTGKWDQIFGVFVSYDANLSPKIDEYDFTGEKASGKVTNIIYDIEIMVYETGAAKHFTENNFEANDDVNRLATITNMNQ